MGRWKRNPLITSTRAASDGFFPAADWDIHQDNPQSPAMESPVAKSPKTHPNPPSHPLMRVQRTIDKTAAPA